MPFLQLIEVLIPSLRCPRPEQAEALVSEVKLPETEDNSGGRKKKKQKMMAEEE